MHLEITKPDLKDAADHIWKKCRLEVYPNDDKSLIISTQAPYDRIPLSESEGRLLLAFLKAVYE